MDSNMKEPTFNTDTPQNWFINGVYHREDGPACVWKDGTKYWYK